MRKASKDDQIILMSIPEIRDGIIHSVTPELSRRKVKFHGRKLFPGPLINAILLHFLMLPDDEQERMAREYLDRFERLLDLDEPMKLEEMQRAGKHEPPARGSAGQPARPPATAKRKNA